MKTRCPGCQSAFEISSELKGATIRCNRCERVFTVRAVKSAPEIPVVSAVDDAPLERRIQPKPVRSVPPRPVVISPPPSESAPPRKATGLLIAAGVLLFGLVLIGLAGAGGFVWWLTRGSSSTPQAQANLGATNTPPAAPQRQRPRPQPGKDGQLSQEMLDYLKGLMAYVKVDSGNQHASGSGFLIKVDGNTGYFITNHHVVTFDPHDSEPNNPPAARPRRPFGPPGFPQMPGMPQVFERPAMPQVVPTKVTVVLGSGTGAERSFPAEVIDSDEGRDLALLKINAPNLPLAIDLTDRADLKETAPVFTVGFPFGEMLALNRTPEVSIGKATITSVRRGKTDKVAMVQLQGDLNPGNSGGPVVDPEGRLVGIAVAHIRGTQIGFAIGPDLLEEMLHRGKATFKMNIVKRDRDRCEVEFVVDVMDVFNSLAEVRLLFAPGSLAQKDTPEQGNGGYAPMANAKTLNLAPAGHRYSGRLTVMASELRGNQLPVQMLYVQRDGKMHYGQPRNHLISFDGVLPSFESVFPDGPGINSVEAGLLNGQFFRVRLRRNNLEMTVVGNVVAGAANPTGIRIVDGNESVTAKSIETLPENYRLQVQVLLQHPQLQGLIHPQPASRPAAQPPPTNESETPPPITNIFASGPRVYLSDMKEYAVKSGQWPFAKNGMTGAPEGTPIKVKGIRSPNGLGMHPPANQETASVKYRLGKQAAVFKCIVAINDSTNWCFSPAIFTVWGDGKKLFESKNIAHNHARTQDCVVDVTGVDVLELTVHVINGNVGVHAVWVEPRLLQKADTVDPGGSAVKKLFDKGPREFLSDLTETDLKLGPWPFGKSGDTGNNEVIIVNGKKSPNGLGLHPPMNGYASVSYKINKSAALFKGAVAFNDNTVALFGPGVFQIYGDGKRLWQSETMNKRGVEIPFSINVSGIDVLEIRVIATAQNHGLNAVWLEPRLLQKADTVDTGTPVAKKLFEKGPREYLSDLTETVHKEGPWPFTKNGHLGNETNSAIAVNGKKSPKGLGMHPPDRGFSSVRYQLDKKAALFKGAVAIDDSKIRVFGTGYFEVYGDGKRLWRSEKIDQNQLGPLDFSIDVTGVTELELRVVAESINYGLHAVWLEPRLLQKSDTADE